MADSAAMPAADAPVPDDILPRGVLPPLRYRDMPPPVPLRRMIGPSVMLAGLALGSGEYVFWPYITFKSGFTLFWACVLGVITQYFVNMEITRWALATGESAMTAFARLSKHWAGIFLLLNVVPWMIPAWAIGTAQQISWTIWGAEVSSTGDLAAPYVVPLTIATLLFCGLALTAGPVVYDTVEKIQIGLVAFIMVVVVILGFRIIRLDAIGAMFQGIVRFRIPDLPSVGLDPVTILGAIAFAGAGGTMNLSQSNYVKEKGYGMGRYIGRMTSPITGKEEAISDVGYHFPATPENMAHWRTWWRRANIEHFLAFLCTCLICLIALALISYSIFYQADGTLRPDSAQYGKDMAFLYGEAGAIGRELGSTFRWMFLVMGAAILFTTEIGVLDAASRISTDIVKVNWLRENSRWSESRIYFLCLWGTIGLASAIALVGANTVQDRLSFFKFTSSLNGMVMFIYSGLLLYVNYTKLPKPIRIGPFRSLMLLWSVLFFGSFAVWTGWKIMAKMLQA